jgi:hypothetical protein
MTVRIDGRRVSAGSSAASPFGELRPRRARGGASALGVGLHDARGQADHSRPLAQRPRSRDRRQNAVGVRVTRSGAQFGLGATGNPD